jgi:hypothetical protein
MVIHADDHMVHQGHAVYDVIPLVGGTLYQLNEHIDRLLAAAEDIGVPPPMSEPAIKRVLLDTTAASLKLNGALRTGNRGLWDRLLPAWHRASLPEAAARQLRLVLRWRHSPTIHPIRLLIPALCAQSHASSPSTPPCLSGHVFVWLTAGRGSFGASTRECVESSLYAVVTTEWADLTQPQVDRTVGWRATATAVPPLPPYFGSLKSPSNLQGAVALAEAQGRGYDVVRACWRIRRAETPKGEAPGLY